MALISCPECKVEMSNTANSCPKCGFNIKAQKQKEINGVSITGGAIMFYLTNLIVGSFNRLGYFGQGVELNSIFWGFLVGIATLFIIRVYVSS